MTIAPSAMRYQPNILKSCFLTKSIKNLMAKRETANATAEPMRRYYESLVGHMQQLEIQYPETFYTQRRTESEESLYWPLAKMQSWLELCDEAYKAVEKYKTTDPALYDRLKKHITIETIFPRFMICEYYAGYYKNDAIEKERRSFYADCEELGFKYYAERVPLTGWFTKWGVI